MQFVTITEATEDDFRPVVVCADPGVVEQVRQLITDRMGDSGNSQRGTEATDDQ